MAVTTKKTFPATSNATTTVFSPVGIQLNNQDDLDVYVTLSGGTRVLQLRQSTGSTAQSSHPQVNNTDGLYFPAVTAGTTLYNYTLSTDNNTITFNSALPSGAVVSCERRTRDADSSYTTFASGSTIRATDLNNSSTESNFTAQDGRNKAFDLEGKLFDGPADSSIKTKLDGIEANATADQTASEIRALVESASDSNVFTDADHSKLNAIEAGATADQTASEIRSLVESASDSNVFTDADHTKLNNLGTLNALSDVDTSGVADGKILKYSSSSSKFIIADDGGGSGGSGVTNGDKGDITVANAGTVSESFTINNEAVTLAKLPHGTSSTDGKFLRSNNGADPTFETVNTNLVADTSPQLGGDLDVQSSKVTTSTTNGNIKIEPNGTGVVEVRGAGGNDGTLQLNCSAQSHGVKIKSPPHSAGASYTLTLPNNIVNGQFLKTDSSGNLSWAAVDLTTLNASNLASGTIPDARFPATLPAVSGANLTNLPQSPYNISINTLSSSSGSGGGSATFNGSATRFTLSNAGTNAQAHIVSVNGVIQKPNSGTSPSEGFAIDGNDIIFASAPASGADFFILTLGNTINVGTPSDNTVTAAKIASGAVEQAKVAGEAINESKLQVSNAPTNGYYLQAQSGNAGGMTWAEVEAGAKQDIFWENGQTVSSNYTITNGKNAMSAGPITINNGIAVTIGTGENWTIV
jgi:hypothetical protein